MASAGHVYCTLLMSDSYLPGATVLAHSLRDCGTTKKLAVLVTVDTLLPSTIQELKTLYDYVIPVERIASPIIGNLHLLGRYELRFAFTKLALWQQLQFEKIVYVDADIVVLRAPDELFDLDVPFAAAPDVGWPDCFNSGLMVLKPSLSEYAGLKDLANSGTSFDGADQGLLNEYFEDRPWHKLSFTYNCTPSATYQYEPAYRKYGHNISAVHFIGKEKPWFQGRQEMYQNPSGVYKELLGRWWAVYDKHYATPASSAYGQIDPRAKTVTQYVRGEDTSSAFGWAATGVPMESGDSLSYGFSAPTFSAAVYEPPQYEPAPRKDEAQESLATDDSTSEHQESSDPISPEGSDSAIEQPMTDPGEVADNIRQGVTQPVPTTQQRKFSAPNMEWDATRFAPPAVSKPEAQAFPSERYEMSDDPNLFHAPRSYPAPPKDMWYKVPEIKPAIYEQPKPIFPWEQIQRPPPTRVFYEPDIESEYDVDSTDVEDMPQSPGALVSEEESGVPDPSPGPSTDTPLSTAASSPPPFVPAPTYEHFSRSNAWDDDMSIDRYVRALKVNQLRQGSLQVLHSSGSPSAGGRPQQDDSGTNATTSPSNRRASLILTDFPTFDERPSLPVTPAPVRRTTFWGVGEGEGGMPRRSSQAEEVPETQWDPLQRLEELRRTSVVAASQQQVGSAETQDQQLPQRDIPESAAAVPHAKSTEEKVIPWRNLEEMFSGEHTQELVAEGVSQAARGADPSQIHGPSRTGPALQTSSTAFSSSHSQAVSVAAASASSGQQISVAITPDSPQPQRTDSSSLSKQTSQELTEMLVRDVEARVQQAKSSQGHSHWRRPRAQTGFNKETPRLGLEEHDEDDGYEGREESAATARMERHDELSEMGEYDIA